MSQGHRPYAGGSIPENYERYLVPLLFLDYAADLVHRLIRIEHVDRKSSAQYQ